MSARDPSPDPTAPWQGVDPAAETAFVEGASPRESGTGLVEPIDLGGLEALVETLVEGALPLPAADAGAGSDRPSGAPFAASASDSDVGLPLPAARPAPAGTAGPPRGRYDVLGLLGQGGMGTVYEARDLNLRRRIALKTLRRGASSELARRFAAEAQVTAQLDHPGVPPVHALEVGPGGPFAYAMKRVEGRTLEAVLDEARAAPPEQAARGLRDRLEAFLRVCEAVAYAHKKGVVHRDLKPANVMVGRWGEVYVVDWGLAKPRAQAGDDDPAGDAVTTGPLDGEADAAATQDGAVVGTPAYMAPEQARGERARVGPHSDQAALGLLLWELVTLARPYEGRTLSEVVLAAATGRKAPPPPGRTCPPELLAVAEKASAVDPAARYPQVTELADDVRRWLRGEETRALPDGPWRALVRRAARRPGPLVVAVAALAALTLAAVLAAEVRQRLALAQERVAAAAREQALADAIAQVGARAQRVTTFVLAHEALALELAGAAAGALEPAPRGVQAPDAPAGAPRLRPPAAFVGPDLPPDVLPSPHYGRPISLDVPVGLAPDGPGASRDLARLAGLSPALGAALRGGPDGRRAADDAAWRAAFRARGGAVAWAYVASARTGALALLPGMETSWDASYDPRVRPWYRATVEGWARGGRRVAWSAPYVDGLLGRVVLACGAPCLGPDDEVLGVAAVDLLAHELVVACLGPEGIAGFRRAALLDPAGREVLASDRDLARPARVARDPDPGELPLEACPYPGVVREVAAGRSGHVLAVAPGGGEVLVVWARLDPLAWTLAVELDARALVGER